MAVKPAHYFELKAAAAQQKADSTADVRVADGWRYIAKTYRWLTYHQLAFGKWQPDDEAAEGETTYHNV